MLWAIWENSHPNKPLQNNTNKNINHVKINALKFHMTVHNDNVQNWMPLLCNVLWVLKSFLTSLYVPNKKEFPFFFLKIQFSLT